MEWTGDGCSLMEDPQLPQSDTDQEEDPSVSVNQEDSHPSPPRNGKSLGTMAALLSVLGSQT